MSTKSGGVLNLKVLADDLGKIRELYSKKGYYKTEVTYDLEQTDPRVARLNIVIKEPKKLYIKEVKIEGAKAISAGDLKSELTTSPRHFWSWITGSGMSDYGFTVSSNLKLEGGSCGSSSCGGGSCGGSCS